MTNVIYAYTRKQAIADGVLIDVSKLARELGIVMPIAVTAAVSAECVRVPAAVSGWQDETGRLWDLLNIFLLKAKGFGEFTTLFQNSRNGKPDAMLLKGHCGPGDGGGQSIRGQRDQAFTSSSRVSAGGFLVLGADKTPYSGIDASNRAALSMLGRSWLEGPNSECKSFLVLDEAQSAGELSMLPSLLTEGREKGVATILSFQDVASIRHIYGKDPANALLSQFGNKAILRLEGDSTAEWASKAFGEIEQFEYTYNTSSGSNTSYGANGATSYSTTNTQSEQRVRKAALMPADFLTLPPTNEANGLTGYYASAEIGLWKHQYSSTEIFEDDLRACGNDRIRQENDEELKPFDASDLARLGISLDDTSARQPKKPTQRKQLGDVKKFEPEDD